MKYFSQMNPPVYKGKSFVGVESALEQCECPSVRQILHRHVTGMPMFLNRYDEYDDSEPIIGNGIDEFDLMDTQIRRQEEIISERSQKQPQRAKQKAGRAPEVEDEVTPGPVNPEPEV
ncbi:hypothetical protein [robinz microvirus RP_42]|nr:hypothetical protein [robinz microvirus RP_42]